MAVIYLIVCEENKSIFLSKKFILCIYMIILLFVFIILLIILYESIKNFEYFDDEPPLPSPIKLTGTSMETMIKLYWHKPSINNENVYSYLIYMKEPEKDINLTTMKYESNKLFYEKTFYGLDPSKVYKFKVRAVSSDGLSEDSNVVILRPSDKNKKIQRIISPFEKKITCLPDSTYKIASKCQNPAFPNADFNSQGHNDLIDSLTEQKSSTLNF